jgi:DinB superfamily
MPSGKKAVLLYSCALLAFAPASAQRRPPTTPESLRGHFASINRRLLEMAKDFPDDKYSFQLKPEMRTFGAVIVHVASGNIYAAKAGRGEKVSWDELDPKDYKTKTQVVALMEKSIADADATLKSLPDDSFAKSVEPWLSLTEHSAEHYGLLVAYYRASGLTPPESRQKK